MADGTNIEWTDATWNPVTGCTVVSAGCTNCYAMKLAGTRLKHTASREGLTIDTKAGPVWNGTVRLNEEWLDQPLRWKRPRTIFVCAHGDLFHESVPDAWIDRVFAVMALSPQHRFQVLTKRADRMRSYIAAKQRNAPEWVSLGDGSKTVLPYEGGYPANVWLGVSVENQAAADERIPNLLATPAAVRFLSCEPLLGPVYLRNFLRPFSAWREEDQHSWPIEHEGAIDWVIVGGENGPRPMHPDWARALRDQCASAGVPFFFKQWGEFAPEGLCGEKWIIGADGTHHATPTPNGIAHHPPRGGSAFVYRVGKRRAGRLLDGVQHDGMPA